MPSAGRSFDSQTLVLLRQTLNEAWDSLTPQQRDSTTKSEMALQILQLARMGERDSCPAASRPASITSAEQFEGGWLPEYVPKAGPKRSQSADTVPRPGAIIPRVCHALCSDSSVSRPSGDGRFRHRDLRGI
jgi:hypothetical protein